MTSLNISLPGALKDYVEGQVASGDWGTPSEYIRDLIRQDKERRAENLERRRVPRAVEDEAGMARPARRVSGRNAGRGA